MRYATGRWKPAGRFGKDAEVYYFSKQIDITNNRMVSKSIYYGEKKVLQVNFINYFVSTLTNQHIKKMNKHLNSLLNVDKSIIDYTQIRSRKEDSMMFTEIDYYIKVNKKPTVEDMMTLESIMNEFNYD